MFGEIAPKKKLLFQKLLEKKCHILYSLLYLKEHMYLIQILKKIRYAFGHLKNFILYCLSMQHVLLLFSLLVA